MLLIGTVDSSGTTVVEAQVVCHCTVEEIEDFAVGFGPHPRTRTDGREHGAHDVVSDPVADEDAEVTADAVGARSAAVFDDEIFGMDTTFVLME